MKTINIRKGGFTKLRGLWEGSAVKEISEGSEISLY